MPKYAVAICDQGRHAPTVVGEFVFLPEHSLHAWKGKIATSMKELSEQVNLATAFLDSWGTPFVTLRIVPIDPEEEPDTTKESLIAANQELLEVIRNLEIRKLAA